MGSKGNKRHVKRFNTSRYTHIDKKQFKFFYSTRPGPHEKSFSLPLGHIIRDILHLANTNHDAKMIIKEGKVLVDGKVRKDPRYAVGLMDVIEISELKKSYRILPKEKIGLYPLEISAKEKEFKLCRIQNKSTITGGQVQLNLHDGRNIIIKVADPKKPKEDIYQTMGVLKIKIPSQEIIEYYPFKESSPIIVISGKNLGIDGTVSKIDKRFGPHASIVKVKTGEEEVKETAYNYSFVIGKSKSVIQLFNK
jgi:small subunit ribosomal protein S4e